MPYYRCAECDLTVYSAAGYSTSRECPNCRADLHAAKPVFVSNAGASDSRHGVREPNDADGAPLAAVRVWRLFLARPSAVPEARHAVRALAGGAAARSALELMTSEVVANAVLHGAGDENEAILLHAVRDNGSIRVEVWDEGTTPSKPEVGSPDALESTGRGLRVVESLAAAWGSRHDETRCVWFELAAEPDQALACLSN